jgi:ribosomal protein S18 acetylase RimI-like enzyme
MVKVLMSAWHRDYGAAGEFYAASQLSDPNYATQTGPYASIEEFVSVNAQSIKERIKEPFTAHVALDNGRIVGYIICEHQPGGLWVNDAVVLPEFQSKGVGKALFEHATKGADNKYIWIWVNTKNPATNFWKKLGFEEVLTETLMRKRA